MRKQRAFASLTREEYHQVSEMVQRGTYEAVREQVNKPRPEGFGLNISIRPLQTLHAKKNRVDEINARLQDKANHGQQNPQTVPKITVSDFDDISQGEVLDVCDEVHDAIMEATRDLALSGENKPSDLLSLQRLADFPARAEYREHKRQLELRKEQRDIQNQEFRNHITAERVELSKRSLALREKYLEAAAGQSSKDSKQASKNSAFKMWTPEEIVSHQAKVEAAFQADPLLSQIGLPPSPAPSTLECARHVAAFPQHDTSCASLPLKSALPPHPRSSQGDEAHNDSNQCEIENAQRSVLNEAVTAPLPPCHPVQTPSSSAPACGSECKMADAQSSLLNENPSSGPSVPLVVNQAHPSLEVRVHAYTLARHFEALEGRDPTKAGRWTARKFKTKLQHCPCGEPDLPCPHHGDFPNLFWETSSDTGDYVEVLRAKDLPYTPPAILIREQEKAARRSAAEEALLRAYPDANNRRAFLEQRAKAHAILRARSYIPRLPGSPTPDESWTKQCPCGAPHSCDLHPDLWIELRYVKPSDPAYVAALKREHIPIYTPTPADLTVAPSAIPPHQGAPSLPCKIENAQYSMKQPPRL